MGSLDPVFGLIEAHRRAKERYLQAIAEMYRLERLADGNVDRPLEKFVVIAGYSIRSAFRSQKRSV